MAINVDEILDRPAFNNLESEKKQALKTMMVKISGKSATESVPVIMGYMSTFSKGRPISQEEKKLMIEAIAESLNDKDKAMFANIIGFMNKN